LRKEKVVLVLRVDVCDTPLVAEHTDRLAQTWHVQLAGHYGEGLARARDRCGVVGGVSGRAEQNRDDQERKYFHGRRH
jgi:hypothetical protein